MPLLDRFVTRNVNASVYHLDNTKLKKSSNYALIDAVDLAPALTRGIRHKQPAQDVVEYGMLIASIVVVVLLGVTAFGHQILPWFQQLAGHITTVGT